MTNLQWVKKNVSDDLQNTTNTPNSKFWTVSSTKEVMFLPLVCLLIVLSAGMIIQKVISYSEETDLEKRIKQLDFWADMEFLKPFSKLCRTEASSSLCYAIKSSPDFTSYNT